MSELQSLIAQIQLHLLNEYPADEWLMTDSAAYTFFKERAAKKKTAPTAISAPQAVVPPPTPAATPKVPPSSLKQEAEKPPVKEPEPIRKTFQLASLPPPTTTDANALKSLLAQVAPKLTLRDDPASKEELVKPPEVLILCPSNAPEGHRAVLNNLCGAISRTWVPCQVLDSSLPAVQQLLATPLKLVLAEGTLETSSPFLSIPSIQGLVENPQHKIALWKELASRLSS